MKKKLAIVALAAVAATAGIYFGIFYHPSDVPVLAQGFGIWESEVVIDDASPGATGEIPFTIICGQDGPRTFTVTVAPANPAKLKDGYQILPEECYGWITVPEEPIYIEAGEYHHLDLPFRVPYSTTLPEGTKLEARVRVTEIGTGGLVALGIEAKWFIIITAMDS